MKKIILVLMLAVWSFGAKYYALSTAPTDGDGSIGSPWNNLIHSNSVAAGDTLLIAGDWTLTETWPDSALSGSATTGMRYILGCDGDWVIGGARPVIGGSAGMAALMRAKSSFTYYGYFNFDASAADSHCVDMRAEVSFVSFDNCIFTPNTGDGIRANNTGISTHLIHCSCTVSDPNSYFAYALGSGSHFYKINANAGVYVNNRSDYNLNNCLFRLLYKNKTAIDVLGTNAIVESCVINADSTGCTGINNHGMSKFRNISLTNLNVGINGNSRTAYITGCTFAGNTADSAGFGFMKIGANNRFGYSGSVYADTTTGNWSTSTPLNTLKVGAE